jgi:hypothetical protein
MATQIVLRTDLIGPGPFQLPLLVHFSAALETPEDKDLIIAEFQSQTARRILAPISLRAVEQLVDAYGSAPLNRAALPSPQLLDLSDLAVVHELPLLCAFNGHLQRGPGLRTLILSTEQAQKVLFPFDQPTYRDLVGRFTAALVFRRKRRH